VYKFVFADHLRLALDAMLLFVVGLFLAWPVVHYRVRAVARLPLAVFRMVLRFLGPSPSLSRLVGLIFGFNATALFVYMASGFHHLLPMVFGIWTGMNVGIIMAMGGSEPHLTPQARVSPGQWVPPAGLAVVCAPLVLALELPCFWFAIAMGISMGHQVEAGRTAYAQALALRAQAYAAVIAPLLFLSAVAEAVAIRGSLAHNESDDMGQR